MSFAQAFQKAQAKESKKGNEVMLKIPDPPTVTIETDPELVPMMYRAQIEGRCSLQYAGDNENLKKWLEEWIYPNSQEKDAPVYQRAEPSLGLDGNIYRLKIKFLFRVFSDCGQDSINRPVLGKHGIPFLPGSGIKGLFERLSRNPDIKPDLQAKVKEYCGTIENPGTLRFLGAYPVGDWASTTQVTFQRDREQITETRYRISDVIHPQQDKQVKGIFKGNAIAQMSLYKPTLIFELSSAQSFSLKEWQSIGDLLRRALRKGLGGKTSSGYGFWVIPQDRYPLDIGLEGIGVSSLLRSHQPEFRPNLFKATLKGHLTRLLGGVCSDSNRTKEKLSLLFGDDKNPGKLKIYWESKSFYIGTQGLEKTPIFKTHGTLFLDAPQSELELLQWVVEFTYVMAGIGKSWRRVWHKGLSTWDDEEPPTWHEGFYPSYQKRAIGCHWEWNNSSFDRTPIQSAEDLDGFLQNLQSFFLEYMGLSSANFQSFKEAWHPQQVSVYCSSKPVKKSHAIHCFHHEIFKTTPAIGGKDPGDKRPTAVSSVWHRMLPIEKDQFDNNQYLEIITIFHGGKDSQWRKQWERNGKDQLLNFVAEIEKKLSFCWGTDLTAKNKR